jgi:DNA-binding transcriptional regulator WhiA
MEKIKSLLSGLFVLALVAIVNSAAIAQDQSAPSQMHQNLKGMSELLKDISAQLSNGKMTPEAQKAAGKITQQVSQFLQDLAGIGSEIHSKPQTDIKKNEKVVGSFCCRGAYE